MSIIQDIRDKYARVAVVAIALALIGFILTDYFAGKGSGTLGGGSNTIGSVNGKKIAMDAFGKKVDQMEDNYKQQGYPVNAATTQNIVDQVWNQEISRVLFQGEFDKLGMRIGKKEKGDILYGPNAPELFKKAGTDEKGVYDPIKAKQQVDQMFKNKQVPQSQKDDVNRYIAELEEQRMGEKYMSLFSNSTNYPRWMVEKQIADNSLIANISMVKVLYTDSSFVDSTIVVSDKEIEEYIRKQKDDLRFRQEASRSINYVNFSAAPTAADSLYAKNKVEELRQVFDTTDNIELFLAGEGVNNYYNGYIGGANIQKPFKDSVFKLPVGGIYGPYLDGGNYILAKLEGVKQMPDTVKVRHILVATMQRDQQSGQMYPVRDSATAYKLADSLKTAHKNGSNFDSLCAKFSDDPGSKDKGGVYEKVYSGQMTAAFNDFIFLNPPGSKGIVKTEFGYHYIEVLTQKGSSAAYKIAYLPKDVVASKETDDAAQEKANAFFGDSPDQKSFDANFEKNIKPQKGIKGVANNIKKLDAQVNGVGVSRPFVKSIYTAKKGEVLKPERIGNDYVVAVVTDVIEEGTQAIATTRPVVEPVLRNRKKAALIKQKFGKITTLEAAAAAVNKPIEVMDSIRMGSASKNLGYEYKVRGSALNPANKGKVVAEAIEGTSGVYVIRVDNISATASAEGSVADQRKARYESGKQSANNPIEALKNAATIKDKRADRY